MKNIYEVAAANKRKSILIIALFVVFVASAIYILVQAMSVYWGYEAGGLGVAGLALIISGLMSLGSYYFSDSIVLKVSGAKPATREDHFNFYTATQNLALAAGLPMPRLYYIEDSAPNAFATGRDPDHAVIVATTGLLDKLTRTELEGVIAHELTHVKNYDVRVMSIVAVLVGMVALLGDWFLRSSFHGRRDRNSSAGGIVIALGLIFAILSPVVARLIQLAISRRREFMADAGAVAITRQPQGLMDALVKISGDKEALEAANKATAHMYIINPFRGKTDGRAVARLANLFNTHPPVEDRIIALRQMV